MDEGGKKRYWIGPVNTVDDFGKKITDTFIDGRTVGGPWAIMTPASWMRHGAGRYGTGHGQKYQKQEDGKWLKTQG
jgi:hypothetical protein